MAEEILPQSERSQASGCPCRPPKRRSHAKSRNGCSTCKRRRVKCDETRPICGNCSRSSLPCDFDPLRSRMAAGPSIVVRRKRGRPMKAWALELSSILPVDSGGLPTGATVQLPQLNTDDLQLYHHYIMHASLALGDDVLWREKVPFLAFEHDYVLRLMLAMASVHQARQGAPNSSRLLELAESHHDMALRKVTELLPSINKSNCSALYVATVLIFNYTLAKPPSKTNFRVNAARSELTWMRLFQGVRLIIECMGLSNILSGYLGLVSSSTRVATQVSRPEEGYIHWEAPLENLAKLLLPSENLQILYDGLKDCYRDVYGTAALPNSHTHGKLHVVVRWLWLAEEDFIQQVERREPKALVLMSYFAVLLRTIECFWFTNGWSHYVMSDVVQTLDQKYADWIRWPQEQI